jgi:serine/threonine protein phosphatase PrpC
VDTANERGGVDNITVVVVKLPNAGGPVRATSAAAD